MEEQNVSEQELFSWGQALFDKAQGPGAGSTRGIPLAMGTALDEKRIDPGDLVLVAAVGAGFTVGSALLRWTGIDWT